MTTRHQVRELHVLGHAISIVERVDSHTSDGLRQRWYATTRTPIAVIVQRGDEALAFRIDESTPPMP